jgi:hypothetical protein
MFENQEIALNRAGVINLWDLLIIAQYGSVIGKLEVI